MIPSILADTGPLYALADRSDQYHVRANHELAIIQSDMQVLVLHPTMLEAYTLIDRYLNLKYAHTWLDSINQSVGLLNPTSDDYMNATKRVKNYPDQHISLFDAILVVVSESLAVPVWTFDSDFDVMRANVWRG